MDPLSHVAFGRTLAGLAPPSGASRRGSIAAVVLGALSPDIDALVMPFGWDRYLRVHEIGTHTLAGTLACALLTAAVVRIPARGARYRMLAIAAWIGAMSHVLLDVVSSARVRPGWPLVDTVVSLPVVAMADPWLVGLCVAGPAAIWAASLPRKRQAAAAIAGATVAFLLMKAGLGVLAFQAYRAARDTRIEGVQARVIEAEWASLHTWKISDRTLSQVRSWRASLFGGVAEEVLSRPLESETPMVRVSRSLSTVRNFLHVHELGFPITVARPEGRFWVLWSDIRFCWNAAPPGAPKPEPIVDSGMGTARMACALWFGGEFDPTGRPLREIVKIGGFTQVRAAAPD